MEVPLHERSWRSLGRELTRNEFLCALAEITTFSIGELEGGIGTAWSLDQVTLSARTSAGHAAADRRVRFFPRRLDFGPVLACEEQAEALLVWNPLPRPIRVNFRERATPQNGFAWALSPPDPDFCGVIPPHEEIGIVVSFAPPAAGRYEDAIPFEFERNPFRAPGEMFTVNYSLKGEGVASLEGEGVAGAVGSSAPGVRGGETTLLEPPLFLPPNPSLNPPFTSVTSTTVLQQGSTYTLVVTGTVTRTFQNLGSLFDAFYCYDETVDGVSQGRCTSNGQQFYGSLVRVSLGGVWSELPLEALGGPNTFPPYNPNHRYEVTFTAPATGNLTLRENGFIIEAASGGYTVEIHGRDGVGPMCPS